MQNDKLFGAQLKLKRKKLNLTQKQMAKIFGISSGHYAQIERSEKSPGFYLFLKMDKWLDSHSN